MLVHAVAEPGRERCHVRTPCSSGPVIPRLGYAVAPQQGAGGTRQDPLSTSGRACKPYAILNCVTVRRADDESFFLRGRFLETGTARITVTL